jgi:colicin import membrane protein
MMERAAPTHVLLELEEERRQQFRRMLWISAALHAVLLLMFVIGWRPGRTQVGIPGVVRVDLVALEPGPAKPAPRPARPQAKPAPKPPPPPKPEKVLLPKEAVAKPAPKPAPKPEVKPAPVPPKPLEEPAAEYDDLLAQLREEAGEATPSAPQAAAGSGAGPVGGGTVVVSPEVFAWMKKAKIHVTRAWVLAPGFRSQPLETEIQVRLSPAGEVLDTRITRRSGNPWYDESVERAIRKASPLPAPPDADEWPFVFRPEDVL